MTNGCSFATTGSSSMGAATGGCRADRGSTSSHTLPTLLSPGSGVKVPDGGGSRSSGCKQKEGWGSKEVRRRLATKPQELDGSGEAKKAHWLTLIRRSLCLHVD